MVCVQNVSKLYRLYRRPADRLVEAFSFGKARKSTEFWALRNVSLEAAPGEILGIVGPNGSGKSTLLQVVSGILRPTYGRVSVAGRVSALLELGAGFTPEFSGRENVYLSAEIMGLSRGEVDETFPAIEKFAEIGTFIDRPVKEYSSGMYVRLAFATAIHVRPDVLIVDEALAVGDAIFANRCIRKLEDLRSSRTTILFVSHDLGIVKRLCHRAFLMVNGQVAAHGSPADVVNRYVGLVHDQQALRGEPTELTGTFRHGDRSSEIVKVRLIDTLGRETSLIHNSQPATVEVTALANAALASCVVGILVRNRLGIDIFGTNTRIERLRIGPFDKGDQFIVRFAFECILSRGEYTLTVATQHENGSSQDWLDDATQFTVSDDDEVAGVVHVKTDVSWELCSEVANR